MPPLSLITLGGGICVTFFRVENARRGSMMLQDEQTGALMMAVLIVSSICICLMQLCFAE